MVEIQIDRNAVILFNRGVAFQNDGNIDCAFECYHGAVSKEPALINGWMKLAEILMQYRRQYKIAQGCIVKAMLYNQNDPNCWIMLADCYLLQDMYEKARYAIGMAEKNGFSGANLHHRLGAVEYGLGNLGRAIYEWNLAVKLDPGLYVAKWDLALAYLRNGDYDIGFLAYEERFRVHSYLSYIDNIPLPRWQGESLEGKTLYIVSEQGIGDCVQFLRFLKFIEADNIVLHVKSSLIRLIEREGSWLPQANLIVDPMGYPLPAADFFCPMMSLPCFVKWKMDNSPYIKKAEYISSDQSKFLKIGLCWKGNGQHNRGRQRSIEFSDILGLAIPNVQLYSLQTETDILQETGADVIIKDLSLKISDWDDTARAMEDLDLIITVDTAIAHVAGAIGLKTWLLLPNIPDWRWGDNTRNSAWYKSIEIFRQMEQGNWSSVIEEVRDRLFSLASENTR